MSMPKLRLAVDFEANHERLAFKQQDGVYLVFDQGVKTVLGAADHHGRREHAAFSEAGNVVLEVSRHQVADLAHRIPFFLPGSFKIGAQHARGHPRRRLRAATNRQDSAQLARQADHGCNIESLVGRWDSGNLERIRQHEFEDFPDRLSQDGQPELASDERAREMGGFHGFGSSDSRSLIFVGWSPGGLILSR